MFGNASDVVIVRVRAHLHSGMPIFRGVIDLGVGGIIIEAPSIITTEQALAADYVLHSLLETPQSSLTLKKVKNIKKVKDVGMTIYLYMLGTTTTLHL